MGNYNLDSNEQIVLQCQNISHGKMSVFNGELILTDMHVIYISKNMLGRTKEIQKYPLRTVKIHNGTAQVAVEKKNNGYPTLKIYFNNDLEVFGFSSVVANEAKKMANNINQLVTGSSSDIYSQKYNAIPGATFAAETLKGTMDTFKDVFGGKNKTRQGMTTESVAKKCSSCGAPISGIRGQMVHCEYCDAGQQL